MQILLLCGISGAAAAVTSLVKEPFGSGWTNGTKYFTYGRYMPAIRYDATESPNYVLRLQNDAPARMMQPVRLYTPAALLNNSAVEYLAPLPTTYGIDASFSQAQWMGGGYAGDGQCTGGHPLGEPVELQVAKLECGAATATISHL